MPAAVGSLALHLDGDTEAPSSKVRVAAVFAAAIFLLSMSAQAQDPPTRAAAPSPSYGDCAKLQVPRSWAAQESWVWSKICAGDLADLQDFAGGSANAADWESWPPKRELSFDFLRTILLVEPYRSAVPPAGVRISGARFRDPVDLSHAFVARDLWLDKSRFDKDVVLEGSHVPGMLSFDASQFASGLDLYELSVDGDLYVKAAIVSQTLDLTAARVRGNAELSDVKVTKTLKMYQFRGERDLTMDGLEALKDIDLSAASTGGYLSMRGMTVSGNLTMEAVQVDGSVFAKGLRAGSWNSAGTASGGNIDFHAAQVKGNVEFTGAHVEGQLDMSVSILGRDLWLDGGQFAEIDLEGASIAGDAKSDEGRNYEKAGHVSAACRARSDDGRAGRARRCVRPVGDDGRLCFDDRSQHIGRAGPRNHDGQRQPLRTEAACDGKERHRQAFGGDINLYAAQIKGNVEFTDAQVEESLAMTNVVIGRDLWLDGDGRFADIDLTGARVGSSIIFEQSEFRGLVDCTDATIGRDVLVQGSPRFLGPLELSGVHVGGSISLKSGVFDGKVIINDAVMGQELQIGQDPSEAGEAAPRIEFHDSLKLRRARVVGNAQIVGTVFKFVGNKIADAMSKELKEHAPTGRAMPTIIDMQALKVGGELRLSQRTSFDGRVNLTFAHIAGNLDLTEGSFRGIDLTGATIDSEIRLGSPQHPAPNWAPPEMLILRNVSAGALQDLPGAKAWPKILDLEGFTYGRLGGSQTASGELSDRPVEDFTSWLEKQGKPSPQSYIQLAQVLRAAGFPDKADEIFYAGRMQEMRQATGAQKFLLGLEYLATGFGIYPLRALYSIGILVFIGTVAFRLDACPHLRKFDWVDLVIYSLDMLLPVVHLRHSNYEFEPCSWPRYYLYFHRLAGFVLASVIIASLTHGSIELHG